MNDAGIPEAPPAPKQASPTTSPAVTKVFPPPLGALEVTFENTPPNSQRKRKNASESSRRKSPYQKTGGEFQMADV